MIEIKEVKTKKDIKQFATYPLKLYKDCPYYVPSLLGDEKNTFNPKKNFNLKDNVIKGFLCYKDGELVGRIAGMINNVENEKGEGKFVRFSRLECIDDVEVFKSLLGSVEKLGKDYGAETIHGPWGFTDQDREGMLTYGFNERSTYATCYSYPYFHERMKELGFEDESKWVEKRFEIKSYDRVTKLADKLKKKYKLKDIAETMSVKEILSEYGDKFFDLLNEAYGKLDGYIPVLGKARENVIKQFATIANLRYISILVNDKDEMAAFGIVLPSIAEALIKHSGKLFPTGFVSVLKSIKKPKELEMALIAVADDYVNTGVNAILISRIMNNVVQDGIENIESNPMLETNLNILAQWKFTDSEIIKKRQTFKKEIGSLIAE